MKTESFTLIEVLVSITLTAIIVVAVTGVWISCTRGWSFAQQHERASGHDDMVTRRVRELFERAMIEKSSRDLFEWRCDNNFDGRFSADKISFTTRWPMELERGRTLLVPIRGTLAVQTVSAGRDAGKKLTWSFEPFSADPDNKEEKESIVFSTQIQSLNIRYWWKEASRWVDDWREEKRWPEAVEVDLMFVDPGSPPREQKFVVALPAPIDPAIANQETPAPAPEKEPEA
jgi:hypothetical protein